MSLYQKYRAKTFGDVLTQDHVTKTLQAAIKNKSFGHAYVFVGTRGTGKTSIARIFARTLNCQNDDHVSSNFEPCNECESCTPSINGGNVDIIEMDAASNRGIEEVRNIKESVDFLPSIGRFKVYIIDEAHMMTKEAFNALLKTLEEPPKHIVFIMCTTGIFKLPPTIISRSQVFELKPASIDSIVTKIEHILNAENSSIDLEGKRLIARLGKGSFRDTESILEKVLNNAPGESITYDQVISLLGLSSLMLLDKAKEFIYPKDLPNLIKFLNEELDEGVLINFNNQLVHSIYEDIAKDIEENKTDGFKLELFEFLSLIDKDLRSSVNPKLIYTSKLLKFISLPKILAAQQVGIETKSERNAVISLETVENQSNGFDDINSSESAPPKGLSRNPSALLRQRRIVQSQSEESKNLAEENSQPAPKKVFISKIDFLNFIQSNNSFLYRFFSSHDFQISEEKLIIDVKRQMEKDLLKKPQTMNLIKMFGDKYNLNIPVEFGEVKLDKRTTEEKKVQEIKKKVEDLDDSEIKEIFSVQ